MKQSSVLSAELTHQITKQKDNNGEFADSRMPFAIPKVSVVVPCYNEQQNLPHLIQKLNQVLKTCTTSYELIFVDDASTDNTVTLLDEMSHSDPNLKSIHHTRNFGQSAALLSGIQSSKGEIVITLDADLQNDPVDIPAMLDLLQHSDAVCGVRQKRLDSAVKRFSSKIANAVRQKILKDEILDAGCCFRAMRRDVLKQLPAFRALHRFLPTILGVHGYRVVQMPVTHHPRMHGQSKYGIGNRLFVGIYDLVGICWYKRRHIPPRRH